MDQITVAKITSSLIDIAAMLDLVHTRQMTGRGPSYHEYSGQVASTLREARALIAELKEENDNGL